MQTTAEESEVELVLKVNTGKYKAVCVAMGLSDAQPDIVLDTMLIHINTSKRILGAALAYMPPRWVDWAIDLLMARRPKKP